MSSSDHHFNLNSIDLAFTPQEVAQITRSHSQSSNKFHHPQPQSQPGHHQPQYHQSHHQHQRSTSLSIPSNSTSTSSTPFSGSSSQKKWPRGESPPFAPTTPAPVLDHQLTLRNLPAILRSNHQPLDALHPQISSSSSSQPHPLLQPHSNHSSPQSYSSSQSLLSDMSHPQPHSSPPSTPSNNRKRQTHVSDKKPIVPHHHSRSTSFSFFKKPPPVSIPPPLRRPVISNSISSILAQHQSTPDGVSGKELELQEQLDWNRRTGRHELLAMRIAPTGAVEGEGGRDRWGNRWGMEGHVLSPVIRLVGTLFQRSVHLTHHLIYLTLNSLPSSPLLSPFPSSIKFFQ